MSGFDGVSLSRSSSLPTDAITQIPAGEAADLANVVTQSQENSLTKRDCVEIQGRRGRVPQTMQCFPSGGGDGAMVCFPGQRQPKPPRITDLFPGGGCFPGPEHHRFPGSDRPWSEHMPQGGIPFPHQRHPGGDRPWSEHMPQGGFPWPNHRHPGGERPWSEHMPSDGIPFPHHHHPRPDNNQGRDLPGLPRFPWGGGCFGTPSPRGDFPINRRPPFELLAAQARQVKTATEDSQVVASQEALTSPEDSQADPTQEALPATDDGQPDPLPMSDGNQAA